VFSNLQDARVSLPVFAAPHRLGLATTLTAYLLWGVLPIYWKALDRIPAGEIICHRIIWSLVFTAALLPLLGDSRNLLAHLRQGKILACFLTTSLLLGTNWLLYVWAVNNGHIIESSLGYFINPLVAVLLGVVVLKERLRPVQWTALAIAFSGVLYLALSLGHPPWIGLALAGTFAFYSLLRKVSQLPSLEGLFLEMAILAVPSLVALLVYTSRQTSHFVSGGSAITLLLVGSGVITALPLLLFIFGARRISMSAVGLLQYVAPTLQFLVGLLLFKEPFPPEKAIGFGLIWAALLLYSVDQLVRKARHHPAAG
jgi:chloramphenicol-sensitive protein RarD